MEFYADVPVTASAEAIQARVVIPALPRLCASVDTVIEHAGERGRIYCLWGEFTVERQLIRQGVRFALPGCPNALAWTITGEEGGVRVHCTINRPRHEPDFIESIEAFVADWAAGLGAALAPDGAVA
ncbi:hypothetical protein [Thioalbus denitrificans]|uniref:Polyketide cyclase/dehydrase/lipid transport protein n=1 Tax=Thioalbus denitrificans TaxID=547122 RepID=A0A369C2T9_9GAMM|nr:hypothetical protein [Thioalbus denitrificans]RCX28290.1 hypothetical protein DFQ59_10733 [Thioalbus denitrificans]